jgi:hypothetical protein
MVGVGEKEEERDDDSVDVPVAEKDCDTVAVFVNPDDVVKVCDAELLFVPVVV